MLVLFHPSKALVMGEHYITFIYANQLLVTTFVPLNMFATLCYFPEVQYTYICLSTFLPIASLQNSKTPPVSALDMILNNLMVSFQ